MGPDVFISYSNLDKQKADAVIRALEGEGISCWIAHRNIVVGNYAEAIIKAITDCKLMVLILSSNSNQSRQVSSEVERAASKNKTIYPLRIENVLPPPRLELFISSEQWMDAFEPPLEKHLEKFARNVKQLLEGDLSSRENPIIPGTISAPQLINPNRDFAPHLNSQVKKSWAANFKNIFIAAASVFLVLLSSLFLYLAGVLRFREPEIESNLNHAATNNRAFNINVPVSTPTGSQPSPKDPRVKLVQDLFAPDSQTRKSGATELVKGYYWDEDMIPILIGVANQNLNNPDGIYNTVYVLDSVNKKSLLAHKELVSDFLTKAELNDKRTKIIVHQIRNYYANIAAHSVNANTNARR